MSNRRMIDDVIDLLIELMEDPIIKEYFDKLGSEDRTQGFKLNDAPSTHGATKMIQKKEPFKRIKRRMNMR
jgi:hypothetical protein